MEMAKKEELAQLMAPTDIIQPKVPFGVDPKTVLCAFFKAGRCQKGKDFSYFLFFYSGSSTHFVCRLLREQV